jgi:hypothetical protein
VRELVGRRRIYAAKTLRGTDWKYLSIPPGGSGADNRAPTRERPDDAIASLNRTNL